MINREKIIEGLEYCSKGCSSDCPYFTVEKCTHVMASEILPILKEQEPVEPEYKLLPGSTTIHEWDCGNCGYGLFMIFSNENRYNAKSAVRYCAGCGRKVKWECVN
jgi:hypothetical protein